MGFTNQYKKTAFLVETTIGARLIRNYPHIFIFLGREAGLPP